MYVVPICVYRYIYSRLDPVLVTATLTHQLVSEDLRVFSEKINNVVNCLPARLEGCLRFNGYVDTGRDIDTE